MLVPKYYRVTDRYDDNDGDSDGYNSDADNNDNEDYVLYSNPDHTRKTCQYQFRRGNHKGALCAFDIVEGSQYCEIHLPYMMKRYEHAYEWPKCVKLI